MKNHIAQLELVEAIKIKLLHSNQKTFTFGDIAALLSDILEKEHDKVRNSILNPIN